MSDLVFEKSDAVKDQWERENTQIYYQVEMIKIITENNFQLYNYFQTLVTNLENSHNISAILEKTDILHDQEPVKRVFKTFCNKFINKTCFTIEQENLVME